MTTLHDRLADLAASAPLEPAGAEGAALWDRGRRLHRLRRTGTAVVASAAVLALVGLGSMAWLRSPSAVEPLPADSPGGVPDRVYEASEWLPGTEGHPLGEVAAAFPSIRRGFVEVSRRGISLDLTGHRGNGIVGISATTGEYRFLDLPDYVAGLDDVRLSWSLSPDGRHVAYFYRDPGSGLEGAAASGIALYDTRTGAVRRSPVPSDLGIVGRQWFWTADDTAVVGYDRITSASSSGTSTSSVVAPLVWDVDDAAAHELPRTVNSYAFEGAGPGFVLMRTPDGTVQVDPRTGAVLRDLGPHSPSGVWDATGTRTADTAAGNGDTNGITPVLIRTLPASPGGQVTKEEVPAGTRVFDIYGWLDEDHLAVLELVGGNDRQSLRVSSMDVGTGDAVPLVDDLDNAETQLAAELLTRPTVPGIEPPTPMDPRQVTGWSVAIVLTAVAGLIWWRRRVRP